MTVKELIDELSFFSEDMEVEFAYNYGDYWQTTVCEKITNVDVGQVEYSQYHRMDKLVDDDCDDDDSDVDKKEVVILQ